MNIFGIYLNKTFIKIYLKRIKLYHFKKYRGSMPPNPPSKRSPKLKKLGLANPAHAHDVCIYTSKSIIQYYHYFNDPVYYTCFLDASKAFDRINHLTMFK